MHQLGWLSERGGNFLNLLQKEGGTQKVGGGFPHKKGDSNLGGNYAVVCTGKQQYYKINYKYERFKHTKTKACCKNISCSFICSLFS